MCLLLGQDQWRNKVVIGPGANIVLALLLLDWCVICQFNLWFDVNILIYIRGLNTMFLVLALSHNSNNLK